MDEGGASPQLGSTPYKGLSSLGEMRKSDHLILKLPVETPDGSLLLIEQDQIYF